MHAHRNTLIRHPTNGTNIFGKFPEIKTKGNRAAYFPEGDIFLKHGEHRTIQKREGRGFGIQHIWAKHELELIALGYPAENDVSRYVANILQSGTPIHSEFDNAGGTHRTQVIRNQNHVVILDQRTSRIDGFEIFDHYSVVTAFPMHRKVKGSRIGALL